MATTVRDQYGNVFGPRRGLEGPFRFKTGIVLYYDPREGGGTYYDPHRDMYVDNRELAAVMGEVPVSARRVAAMWLRQSNMVDDWLHRGSDDEDEDELEGKTADINWEQFSKPLPKAPVWQNYNTIGPRRFIKTLTQVLESRLPATWYYTEDPTEVARMKKKWRSKGHSVKERGVQGFVVSKGMKNMFVGMLAGKEVAVRQGEFKF